MIQFSQTAMAEIQRLQAKPHNHNLALHLSLQSGGCLPFTYHLHFAPQSGFQSGSQPGSQLLDCQGLAVWLDRVPGAAPDLSALVIDYSEDLMGGGFRFLNPQATKVCSCGNSFSL